jgi:hypothetical protein
MPKPSSKQAPAIGDIVVVPLSKTKYAFARIINLKDGWDLAEVFQQTAKTPDWTEDILQSPALYPPVSIDTDDIRRGSLKTVARTPGYEAPYLSALRFVRGTPGKYTVIRVNQYSSDGPISDQEAAALPKQAFYALEGMIARVKQILAANVPAASHLLS